MLGKSPESRDALRRRMARVKFPYQRYDINPSRLTTDSSNLYRPEIPFRAVGNRGDLYLWGLVDTGADSCTSDPAKLDTLFVDALKEVWATRQ